MTFDEMARIVDQAREVNFYWHQLEQRKWDAEQRAKAGAILELLRQHLPPQVRQEAEELLSTEYGCECVCDLLRREKKAPLLEERPEAESEEIEDFLDTGVWRSKARAGKAWPENRR